MSDGGIRSVRASARGNPEIWMGIHGLDAFSEALTSFRITILSLLDFIRLSSDMSGGETRGSHSLIRRAIEGTSLVVPAAELGDLVVEVGEIYAQFDAAILRIMRDQRAEFRAQQTVENVADHPEQGRFEVTGIMSFELPGDFVEERLRQPLADAVRPYVAPGLQPETVTADLGLLMEIARPPAQVRREAALMSGVAAFEIFLGALTSALTETDPTILRGSKITFSALDVLDAGGKVDLVSAIRRDVVATATRNFASQEKFLVAALGAEGNLRSVREVIEARNVHVHHGGRISQQYVVACPTTQYQIGDEHRATAAYVRSALERLGEIASALVTASRRRAARPESGNAEDT